MSTLTTQSKINGDPRVPGANSSSSFSVFNLANCCYVVKNSFTVSNVSTHIDKNSNWSVLISILLSKKHSVQEADWHSTAQQTFPDINRSWYTPRHFGWIMKHHWTNVWATQVCMSVCVCVCVCRYTYIYILPQHCCSKQCCSYPARPLLWLWRRSVGRSPYETAASHLPSTSHHKITLMCSYRGRNAKGPKLIHCKQEKVK